MGDWPNRCMARREPVTARDVAGRGGSEDPPLRFWERGRRTFEFVHVVRSQRHRRGTDDFIHLMRVSRANDGGGYGGMMSVHEIATSPGARE